VGVEDFLVKMESGNEPLKAEPAAPLPPREGEGATRVIESELGDGE
jgi:hypothetical protein